jgi:hypothetical protein
MLDNLYANLAGILLIPLLPAFLIYKFLPEKDSAAAAEVGGETVGIGPVKGLSWKLKGAFAGYFLLVCVGMLLQYLRNTDSAAKKIAALELALSQKTDSLSYEREQLALATNQVVDWHVKGTVLPAEKDGTRFFYDDGTTKKEPTGEFTLIKRSLKKDGKIDPPKWICVYNPATGYKVVNLNRELEAADIKAFNVTFDDNTRTVLIKKPIEINSTEKDSILAVASFIESKPELKNNPEVINEATKLKVEVLRNERKIDRLKMLPNKKISSAIQLDASRLKLN